jgi:hypothetical protein
MCNHDSTFLSICDLNQKRKDGKKCSVHHHDFVCSERETEDTCKNRQQGNSGDGPVEPIPSQAACNPVAPTGAPTVNKPAGRNDCLPSPEVVNWDVVSVNATDWGVCVSSLALSGVINIKPWPSEPAKMIVPNTANPTDGGNINNVPGSKNNWSYAIDDMADYDTAGPGGAGIDWHSTVASEAHEWAHWNEDYKPDAIMSNAGGNWPQTNTDLNALTEPKASSPTAGQARAALEPRVTARIATFINGVDARWNHLIGTTDKPGKGGRGYAAGMRVLNQLIAQVRSYKAKKGW